MIANTLLSTVLGFVAFFSLAQAQTSSCQLISPNASGESEQVSTVSLRISNTTATSINTKAVFNIPLGITPINLGSDKIWSSVSRNLTVTLGTFQPDEEKQILQEYRGRPTACIVYGALSGEWSPAPQSGPKTWNSELNFSLIITSDSQSTPSPAPTPTPTPTPTSTPEPQTPTTVQEVIDNTTSAVTEVVENTVEAVVSAAQSVSATVAVVAESARQNEVVQAVAPETTTAAAAVGAVATAVSVPWWNLIQFFNIAALGSLKKRTSRSWGIVYDKATRHPIAGAAVHLFEASSQKQKNVSTTDSDGRFGFLAPEGEYYLKVFKADFVDYQSSPVRVSGNQTEALNLEIPLASKEAKLVWLRSFFSKAKTIFEVGGSWMLVVGTLISLVVWFIFPTNLHLGILLFYILMDILKYILDHLTSRSYGVVTDRSLKTPIPLAVVRVYESRYNWLLATFVTDRDGRFKFLVTPGNYYVTCAKPGYEAFQSPEMPVRKSDIINLDIPLAAGK